MWRVHQLLKNNQRNQPVEIHHTNACRQGLFSVSGVNKHELPALASGSVLCPLTGHLTSQTFHKAGLGGHTVKASSRPWYKVESGGTFACLVQDAKAQ